MKQVLREEINSMKSLMKINEDMITVSSGGYDYLTTDNDATSSDKINRALLDDINTAAKRAGIKVTVTTAASGHGKLTKNGTKSRHTTNQAVDIAIMDGIGSGGATGPSNGSAQFRTMGNKLTAELEKMGYTRNMEGPSNPKAVFWQTNSGGNHFNHVHVSNTTGESSKGTDKDGKFDISPEREKELGDIAKTVQGDEEPSYFDKLVGAVNQLKTNIATAQSRLGESAVANTSFKVAPSNVKVKSSHSGKIVSPSMVSSGCEKAVLVRFSFNNESYFIEYCGIDKPRVSVGDKVSEGQLLGEGSDDVYATYYNNKLKPVTKDIISNPSNETENPKTEDNLSGEDIQGKFVDKFKDDSGTMGKSFGDAFYNLFKNLNPMSSRYAIDPETGKPVKVHQGGLSTTKSKDSKPNLKYGQRIKYASTKKGAKTKGLNTPEKLKEELQQMKNLMK